MLTLSRLWRCNVDDANPDECNDVDVDGVDYIDDVGDIYIDNNMFLLALSRLWRCNVDDANPDECDDIDVDRVNSIHDVCVVFDEDILILC